MSIRLDLVNCIQRPSIALTAVLMLVSLPISANAQTQASCQFNSFNRRFFINSSSGFRTLVPRGVNDYNSVAGSAQDDGDFSVRGFTRFSSGSISYYRHNSADTFFTDRTNAGVTIGVIGGQSALGSMNGTPFMLQGSTFTPLTMTIAGKSFSKFTVWGVNRYGTSVALTQTPPGTRTALSVSVMEAQSR